MKTQSYFIRPSSSRLRGFTLIELMVVIVIVAALAALAFTLSSKAKQKTCAVQDIQNLREWSLVFGQAASDNNGRVPTPNNWAAISNQPYNPRSDNPGRSPFVQYWDDDLNRAFEIQLDRRSGPCLEEGTTPTGNPAPTYMLNWRLSQPPEFLEMHLGSVQRSSKKILFIDGAIGAPLRLNTPADITNYTLPTAEVYGGRAHAVFADLHVAPVQPNDVVKNWSTFVLPQ